MKTPFVAAIAICLISSAWLLRAQHPATHTDAGGQPDGLAQGKAIFVSRCAKCHDDNGNKKLADGTTLLARLAESKDPEARLGTRLKNPQERRQVMLYMRSMIEQYASTPTAAKPH
jgi:mono/diheme cytochrome c family protein